MRAANDSPMLHPSSLLRVEIILNTPPPNILMRILFKTDKWNHLCCVRANVSPDVEHIFMWRCSILTSAASNGPH